MADDYVKKTAEAGERAKARERELERQKKARAEQYAQYMAKAPQTEWHQKKKQAIKKAMPSPPPTPPPTEREGRGGAVRRSEWPTAAKEAAAKLHGYMEGIEVGRKREK